MNTAVNFELAKLLKEKGFDNIDCNGYYHVCDRYTRGYAHCYSHSNTQEDDAILAPTIAEVVMWLYEKYGIWIEVYMDDDATFGYLISEITNEGRADTPIKRGFNSPTEAYEKGIEYTLQNRL